MTMHDIGAPANQPGRPERAYSTCLLGIYSVQQSLSRPLWGNFAKLRKKFWPGL